MPSSKQRPLIRNLLRPKNFQVLLQKAMARVTNPSRENRKQVADWCAKHAEDTAAWASSRDGALWKEAVEFGVRKKAENNEKLNRLGIVMGGGGNYPLLYFITRYMRPATMVETGVAAGWSSQAILTALHANGNGGHLFSSDFPYLGIEKGENYVGILVPSELKTNWTLMLDGDRKNLPAISRQAGHIDILHYDSDKTYSGREFALKTLASNIDAKTIVVFDDIDDNAQFMDLAARTDLPWKVFGFEGKFLGLVGNI